MLNFIYYPVSWILEFWHMVFGFVFGPANGAAWALAVVFLVFTLRALLYKPFVHQVRSMRKMQEFAPEIQRLKKKYGNDKQKMAEEMQRLQRDHGVNPLGGCLPVLVQVPVFIGLFHVLREFRPGKQENYSFDASQVQSFNDASIFGAKLGASLVPYGDLTPPLEVYNTTPGQMLVVMIPLMIAAGLFTHITARHSVARQPAAQLENPQTAIMNKLTLYVFPIGVVVGAPFLPLAILFYWVANNLWTLGQQRVVYSKIDREEAEKATKKTESQRSLAPKVGQKPDPAAKRKKPGAKPIAPATRPANRAAANGTAGRSAAGKSSKSGKSAGKSEGKSSSTESTQMPDKPAEAARSNGATKANGAAEPRPEGAEEHGRENGTVSSSSTTPAESSDGSGSSGSAGQGASASRKRRKRSR